MPSDFNFKIKGDAIAPKTVDAHDLFQVVDSFYKAVRVTSQSDAPLLFSLTDIQKGSVDLVMMATADAFAAMRRIGSSVGTNRPDLIPFSAQKYIREMWIRMKSHPEWGGIEVSDKEGSGLSFTLSVETEPFPERLTYSGDTVVYGECTRSGGTSKATAQMRLSSGENLTVKLKSRELAQSLGKRLYETVGLQGVATWDLKTDRLIDFTAEELTDFVDREDKAHRFTTVDAFENLAIASGDKWNDMDVDKYVNDLRRDSE